MHFKIATADKFQLVLKNNYRNISDCILTQFLSNRCILNLVSNVWNMEKSIVVCMASFCRQMVVIHPIFCNMRLKFSTYAYFMVLFHFKWSKYKSKGSSVYFST